MAMTGTPNQYDVIQDGQRIDEFYDDTQHIADTNQGWGRLNIYKALFPLAPRVQRFDDNITGIDADVISYKVNVDNEEELEAAFKIRTIPTLLLCRMDGNKEMMLGTMGKPELRKVIEGIL